jgi:hypothetical protein
VAGGFPVEKFIGSSRFSPVAHRVFQASSA